MGQTFVKGYRIPVTKVLVDPCVVTQTKSQTQDGYWAVQLGMGSRKAKNTSKPLQGHLKKITNSKLQIPNFPRYLREIRLDKEPEQKAGDQIRPEDIFKVGDVVSVKGISKGKGFAGVVKRWHFAGGPKTHGQSDRQRAPGSIGGTTTPGRVYRGKHMAGRMGGDTITVKNLHIVSVDPEKNELSVSGPIPGRSGSLIFLTKISSGSLAELEHEIVSQVKEGEPEATEKKEEEKK